MWAGANVEEIGVNMRKKRKMLQLWIVGEEVDWSKCKKKRGNAPILNCR